MQHIVYDSSSVGATPFGPLVDRGFAVLPLAQTDKGKRPAVSGWGRDGLGLAELGGGAKGHSWDAWGNHPLWAFFPASSVSRPLWVADCDSEEACSEALSMFGDPIVSVQSTRGWHMFYDQRPGVPVRSRNGFRAKLDIKAAGGYVRIIDGGKVAYALDIVPVDYSAADKLAALMPARVARVAGKAVRSLSVAAVQGDSLPMGCVLDLDDGRTVAIADLGIGAHEPCYCPWRSESNPSAFVHVLDDGRVFVHDSGTGVTRWWLGRIEVAEPASFIPKQLHLKASEWLSDVLPDYELLDRATVLDAGLGLGKTTWANELATEATSVLSVAPEVALVESLAQARLSASYKTEGRNGPRVATTIHSLAKVPMLERDLLVLEEAPLLAKSLFDKTAKGQGRARLVALTDHLSTAKKVVISSADIDAEQAGWWSKVLAYAGHRETVSVRVTGRQRDRSVRLMARESLLAAFEQDVKDHQRKGTIVLCAGKASAARTAKKRVEKLRPDLSCVVLTSKTAKDHAQLFSDPDTLATFDVVICTGVLRSGFSVDAPVARVYLDANYSAIGVADVCQAAMRWRAPVDKTLRVSITPGDGEKRETYPEAIKAQLLSKATANDVLVSAAGIAFTSRPGSDGQQPATELDELLLDIWAQLELQRRAESFDRLGEFLRCCQRHGWKVERDTTMPTTEEIIEARAARSTAAREIEAEDTKAVLDAPVVTEEQAQDLRVQPQLTSAEHAALEAHKIREFYGEEPTEETVKGGEEMRDQLADLVRVGAWTRGDKTPAILEDARQRLYHDVEKDHYTLRTAVLAESVEATGISIFSGGLLDVDRFTSWLEDNKEKLQTTLRTGESDASRLFGKVVRSLGGKVVRKWSGPKNQRVAVPAADFSHAWDLADYHRRTVEGAIYALTCANDFTIAA